MITVFHYLFKKGSACVDS